MDSFPGVITAELLSQRLNDPDLRVIEVSSLPPIQPGYIPGAARVDPQDLTCGVPPATGKLPTKEQLDSVFGRVGYSDLQTIVVTDIEGGGWAGRLAWTLDVIGHKNWLYLDGGLRAWIAAGLPLVDSPTEFEPTSLDLSVDRSPIVTAEEIVEGLEDRDRVIWDCRSVEEFVGLRRSAARAGHIPGAVNLDWLDLMDNDNNLCLVKDLEALLASKGITQEKDVITHCQTHHRSGLTYMAARLLGFERIRAYDGSWSEWGNRDDTPIE